MGKRSFTDLRARVITALLMFAAVCALLFLAPAWGVALAASLAAGIAMWEFQRMAEPHTNPLAPLPGILLAAALPSLALLGAETLLGGIAVALLLLAAVAFFEGRDDMAAIFRKTALRGWGLVYFGGLFACLVLLFAQPGGGALVLFLIVVVACADIGAYFTGHTCGRRKLAPAISPGKTIEGLLGGVVAAAFVGGFYGLLPHQAASVSHGVILGASLSLISVAGDLLESACKRSAGVKDSSRLLPGHGGLWDRVDGLLPAAGAMLFLRGLL